jgi:hypothetical protein
MSGPAAGAGQGVVRDPHVNGNAFFLRGTRDTHLYHPVSLRRRGPFISTALVSRQIVHPSVHSSYRRNWRRDQTAWCASSSIIAISIPIHSRPSDLRWQKPPHVHTSRLFTDQGDRRRVLIYRDLAPPPAWLPPAGFPGVGVGSFQSGWGSSSGRGCHAHTHTRS